MARRDFSTVRFFDQRCAELEPFYAFNAQDEADARGWRMKAQAKVRDLLGESPETVQLEPEIIESVDMGAYVREKFVFDADAHSSVPGYILVPKQRLERVPALLCPHGHGPGKDVVAGVTDPDELHTREQKEAALKHYNYDYARQFAERGYVTLTFDLRCFGERADADFDPANRDRCNVQFIRGALLGISLLTLNIHDMLRAVDYLEQRPEVDPERIGCVGLSLGGTMTMWATALDRRIKAAVISGYLCELETFAVNKANFCGVQFVPGLRRYFDLCDIASLIAPRPLLIQSGAQDDGFPIDSARRAFRELQGAYKAWGKPQHLAHDIFEGGHQFHSETAFEWFDKWLKGQ